MLATHNSHFGAESSWFTDSLSDPNKYSLCVFQRYSVAVYLVRVFTAADLFNQLKLCSVESAERCRERSKLNSECELVV